MVGLSDRGCAVRAQMLSMVAGWLQLGSLAFMLFGSKVSHRQ